MHELLGIVLLGTVNEFPYIVPTDCGIVPAVETDVCTGVELVAHLDDFVTEFFQMTFVVQEDFTDGSITVVMLLANVVTVLCPKQDFEVVAITRAFEAQELADLVKVVYDFHDCLLTYSVERSKQWSVMLYPTIGRTSQILTSSVSLLM